MSKGCKHYWDVQAVTVIDINRGYDSLRCLVCKATARQYWSVVPNLAGSSETIGSFRLNERLQDTTPLKTTKQRRVAQP